MDKVVYNVKNRSSGMVIYRIPEDNIRREFAPGEVKKISFEELEKLPIEEKFSDMIKRVARSKDVTELREFSKGILLYVENYTRREKTKKQSNEDHHRYTDRCNRASAGRNGALSDVLRDDHLGNVLRTP